MNILTIDQALEHPGLQWLQFPHPNMAGYPHMHPCAHIHYADGDGAYPNVDIPNNYYLKLQGDEWIQADSKWWIRFYPPDNPLRPKLDQYVQAISDKYPAAKTRAERAAELVLADKVAPMTSLHKKRVHEYWVTSQNTPGRTYEVYIAPNNRRHWVCMIVQDPVTKHSHLNCPDCERNAPFLKYGKRCKHMLAAWMYAEIHGYNKEPGPPHQEHPGSTAAKGDDRPNATTDSTTPTTPPANPPRRLVAKYADGRPAKYSDGSIVRYTAGGKAVLLPPSSW